MSLDVLLPKNAVQVVRGSSKTISLTVTKADGTPLDLTNAQLVFTVKEEASDSKVVFRKVSTDTAQIRILSAKGGTAEIYITPPDTHNRDVKNYVFDVWAIYGSGARYVVVMPTTFEITYGVTWVPLT